MSCLADTHASHRQLRGVLTSLPQVVAVDTLDTTPVETELVLVDTDTVPPVVLNRIAGAGLGIRAVDGQGDALVVVVR
jgi:hypothetical protein